jgi:segregation and condensation protein A
MQIRESAGLHTYLRLAPPLKVQAKLDLSDFTLADVVEAAHRVFSQADQRSPLGTVVTAPRITIREKIGVIVNSLRKQSSLSFLTLLGKGRTRLDVVVTFLAMLELVKRRFIRAQQDNLFGDITLVPSETWDEDLEFELEFGE